MDLMIKWNTEIFPAGKKNKSQKAHFRKFTLSCGMKNKVYPTVPNTYFPKLIPCHSHPDKDALTPDPGEQDTIDVSNNSNLNKPSGLLSEYTGWEHNSEIV